MNPVNHILVVEDDDGLRTLIADALAQDGHRVSQVSDGDQALELLSRQGFQLIITDLNLPGASGMEILDYLHQNTPETPVVVMTSFGSVDTAVEAMRRGASDFQEKPLNLEHLRLTVGRTLEKATLHHAYDYLRHEQPYIYRLEKIQAASPAMAEVMHQVRQVAPSEMTVLLTGETGTGKSLVAGAIHANSPRRNHTIVTVNCAALTETLLESELFGHERGAFTGAHKTRTGRFQQAHGGTLFLDEVGEMSPTIQAKVLRAIEDKVIQRVGGSRQIQVDVRIMAATNRNLAEEVRNKNFREDLYYRLNVATIHLPPLRERTEDVIPLAEKFLRRVSKDLKRGIRLDLSPEAKEVLLSYHWPGNIRELRNVIERASLFAKGTTITPQDLSLNTGTASPGISLDTLNLAELERRAVETALERSGWVQLKAAKLLGISPRVLSYKLNKLDIKHPKLRSRGRRG